jgi:hypothetical protein
MLRIEFEDGAGACLKITPLDNYDGAIIGIVSLGEALEMTMSLEQLEHLAMSLSGLVSFARAFQAVEINRMSTIREEPS